MSARDTTFLVRAAKAGDPNGLADLVGRLSPLLVTQARYRLGAIRDVDPEDVVQDVWLRVLDRLPELRERDGRHTPVLIRFLSTTILHRVQEILRERIRRRRGHTSAADSRDPIAGIADETVGVVSRALRNERKDQLWSVLDDLDADERELLVLRGIEQQENKSVAESLRQSPNAVSLRYNRLLGKLRARLEGSVFEEL